MPHRGRRWLLVLALGIAAAGLLWTQIPSAQAAACASAASGNWNNPATWTSCGGSVPGAADTVTISGTHTVTVTATAQAASLALAARTLTGGVSINSGVTLAVGGAVNIAAPGADNRTASVDVGDGALTANSVSISGGTNGRVGSLQIGGGAVTLTGGVSFSGTAAQARLIFNGSGTLTLGGNLGAGGALTGGSGTIVLNGTTAQTLGAYTTYGHVTIANASGGVALTGTTTVNGTITVNAGSVFTVGAVTLTAAGTTNVAGRLNITSTTGTKTFTGPVAITGDGIWDNSAGEAVEFRNGLSFSGQTFTSGSATQTFSTNSQTIAASQPMAFSGTLAITGAITVTYTGTLTVAGSITGSVAGSVLRAGVNARLNAGAAVLTTGTLDLTTNTLNTVDYNGSAAQTIKATTYSNLYLSTSSSKTAGGALTVNGEFQISDAALFNAGTSLTHTFTGDWVVNTTAASPLTFTTASTINFNSASPAAPRSIRGSAAQTVGFGTLNISNTRGVTLALTASATSVTVTSGATLTVNGALLPGAAAIVGGAGTLTGDGTVRVSRTAAIADFNTQYTVANKSLTDLTVDYTAATAQVISALSYGNLKINNAAGVTMGGSATVNSTLTLTAGTVTTGANTLTVGSSGPVARTDGFVIGNLRKTAGIGAPSLTFEIGTTGTYAPVTVAFTDVTVAGTLMATTAAGDHGNIASSIIRPTRSVNRTWTLSNAGITFGSANATFNFVAGDVDAGANTSFFIVGKRDTGWSYPGVASRTATSTQATGLTSFSAFQLGEAVASQLGISTINGGAEPTAGTTFDVVVEARDANGNAALVTASTGVSLSLQTGTGTLGGALSGTIPAGASSTTISGATYTKAEEGVVLTATRTSGDALAAGASAAFTVGPGAVTKLIITTQPAGATAGAPFGAAPVLRTADAFNNFSTMGLAGSVAVAVTLQAGTGPLQGTLVGDIGTGAGNSTVTFSDLRLDAAQSSAVLRFSAAGLLPAESFPLDVAPAAATALAIATEPAGATSGAPFATQPVVQSVDAFGNPSAIGLPANVPLEVTVDSGLGILQGTLTLDLGAGAGNGTATFSDLRLDRAQAGLVLRFSAAGFGEVASAAFDIAAGPVARLVVAQEPAGAVVATPFGTAPIVRTADAFGNFSTAGLATALEVTVALQTGEGPLLGTLTRDIGAAAGNGTLTFAGLRLDAVQEGVVLRFSTTGLDPVDSLGFAVAADAASRLALVAEPLAAQAGVPLAPGLSVRTVDALGNVSVSGLPDALTVTATLHSGTGALLGVLTADIGTAAGNGLVTFHDLRLTAAQDAAVLRFSAAGLGAATSDPYPVAAGPVAGLTVVAEPGGATAGDQFAITPELRTVDAFGNVSTADLPGSLTVTTTLWSGAGPLQGTLTADIGAGAGNGALAFPGLRLDTAQGGAVLRWSAPGLDSLNSAPFSVSPAVASGLAISDQPGSGTAGQAFGAVTVIAVDAFGNPSTVGLGVSRMVGVMLVRGDGALQGTLSRDIGTAAGNGAGAFGDLRLDVAQPAATLRFSAPGLGEVESAPFFIAPTTATQILLTSQPGGATAGQVFGAAPVLRTADPFGNPSTLGIPDSLPMDVSLAPGIGPLEGTLAVDLGALAANGAASFADLRLDTVQAGVRLRFTAPGFGVASSEAFNVSPAELDHFDVEGAGGGSIGGQTAGVPFGLRITARDAFGNIVTGFDGAGATVQITATGVVATGGGASADFVSGVLDGQTLTVTSAGTVTINVVRTGGGAAGASPAFSVAPAVASRLALVTTPTGAIAGQAINPAPGLRTEDAFGNPSTVGLSAGLPVTAVLQAGAGPLAGGIGADIGTAAGNGQVSFPTLSLSTAQSGVILQFQAPGLAPAVTPAFAISPAPASQLVLVAQPGTGSAGAALAAAVVESRDAFGNRSTVGLGGAHLVTVSLASGGTLGGTLSRDLAAGDGAATFADLRLDAARPDAVLRFEAPGLGATETAAIPVAAGPATRLVLVRQPAGAVAAAPFPTQPVLEIRDDYGNPSNVGLPPGFAVTVTLLSGTGPLTGTSAAMPNGTTVSFSDLRLDVAQNDATLRFTAPGFAAVTSAPFNVGGNSPQQPEVPGAGTSPGNGPRTRILTGALRLRDDDGSLTPIAESVISLTSIDRRVTVQIPVNALDAALDQVFVRIDRVSDMQGGGSGAAGTGAAVRIPSQTLDVTITDVAGTPITRFSAPITLVWQIDPSSVDLGSIVVYYFDPEGEVWIPVPARVESSGRITLRLSHLTTFALFSVPVSRQPLSAGWNFVAFTGLAGSEPEAVAARLGAGLEVMARFNAETQRWDLYRPTAPAFTNTLHSLRTGDALFVRVGRAAPLHTPDFIAMARCQAEVGPGFRSAVFTGANGTALAALFPDGTGPAALFRFHAGTQQWLTYRPGLPASFSTLRSINSLTPLLFYSPGAAVPLGAAFC